MPLTDLSVDEISRVYGPWQPRTPADAARLFEGYAGRWWIAGGWAIEAFTGVGRQHGDLDCSIPRDELPLLRRHLAGRQDLWAADQETLRLLIPADADHDTVPASCENVWTRSSGGEPWQYDVILMAVAGDRWSFKRDPRITRPVEQILWSSDAVLYLRPEIQLLHKARGLRDKDQADFRAAQPLLDRSDRRWLREALQLAHPGHPWIDDL